MTAYLFAAITAAAIAILALVSFALCSRINDRRSVDQNIRVARRAREAALKEVVDESDTFDDKRDQYAIRSAVWGVKHRDALREATSGGAITEE